MLSLITTALGSLGSLITGAFSAFTSVFTRKNAPDMVKAKEAQRTQAQTDADNKDISGAMKGDQKSLDELRKEVAE